MVPDSDELIIKDYFVRCRGPDGKEAIAISDQIYQLKNILNGGIKNV